MKGLDLSKFKKVSQDKKSATLHHPDGHMIRIAISGLSPDMKKKLIALPLHQAKGSDEPIKKLEEEEDDIPEVAAKAPQSEEENTDEEEVAPPSTAPAPAQTSPAQTPAQQAPTPQQAPVAADSAPQPAPAAQEAAAPEVPLTPEQKAANRTRDTEKFYEDMKGEHIHPKTYNDLFHSKSTLGKLGNMFAVVLGGIGSGLTGQPNAALEMMNKEIERDFEGQKNDQSNKLNWYKASIEHEKSMAENRLTHAHAEEGEAKAAFENYKNAKLGITNMKASAQSLNNATAASIASFQKLVDKLPPGPLKDGYQAKLNNEVIPFFLNKIAERNLTVEKKGAAVEAANPPPAKNVSSISKPKTNAGQSSDDVVDQKKLSKMFEQGSLLGEKAALARDKDGNPTAIDPNDKKDIYSAVDKKRLNYNNYKDVMDAYNALASMPDAGQTVIGDLSHSLKKIPWIGETLHAATQLGAGSIQRPRDQLLDALSQRLSAHGASTETMEMIKNALAPSMFDTPETMKKGAELVHQHFDHREETHPEILKRYNLDKEMPVINFNPTKIEKKPDSEEGVKKEEPSLFRQMFTPQEHKK